MLRALHAGIDYNGIWCELHWREQKKIEYLANIRQCARRKLAGGHDRGQDKN